MEARGSCGLSASYLRQMRILVSDPAPVGDLIAYLRRCGCDAYSVGRAAVEATPPERPPIGHEYLRLELDAYLRVWREMHEGVKAELVESPKTAS